jgi:hypothetical protein
MLALGPGAWSGLQGVSKQHRGVSARQKRSSTVGQTPSLRLLVRNDAAPFRSIR